MKVVDIKLILNEKLEKIKRELATFKLFIDKEIFFFNFILDKETLYHA